MGKFKLIRALDIVKDARKAAPLEYEEMVRSLPKVVSMKSIQERIRCGEIRTLEAFAAEMKWIYHNSVIYNGSNNNLFVCQIDKNPKFYLVICDSFFKEALNPRYA